MSPRPRAVLAALTAALLAMTLGGQVLTDSLAVCTSGADTTDAVGRAASSYFTGLRTYAASALWNRLDPLMHGYYGGVSLDDQRYMVSTIALVEWLDPHLEFAYPVGSWILTQNERVDEGLTMAQRGVDANPHSGALLGNLAQLEYLYGDGATSAAEVAERALGDDVEWPDAHEKHTWYPILGDIFRQAGRDDLDAIVQAELVRLDEELGDELAPDEHDHDHDGVPDH